MGSYVEELNQLFWTLTIFILFTCALIFLARSLKKEEKDERLLMLGFTSVIFGLALTQFIWFLNTILIPHKHTLDLMAILCYAIGFTLFFFIFDKTMQKTKFIPFVINVILISLLIVFVYRDPYLFFTYLSYVFNATVFCFILLWFSRKSGDEFKEPSLFLLTGAVLYLIGSILQSAFIVDVISYSPIITYAFIVGGALLFSSPVLLQREGKAKFKRVLIICLITCITLVFVALYFLINLFLFYQVHYLFIFTLIVMICGSIIIVIHFLQNMFNQAKPLAGINGETAIGQKQDPLSVFSLRELNTKKEISLFKSLFKEKHVAKGSRLTKADILQNETRKRIYDYLRENSVVYFHQIMRGLNLPNQTVIWHVNLLFSFDFIGRLKIEEHYNHYVYYDKELSGQQAKKFYFLKNKKCQAILKYLRHHEEGCSQTRLASQLGMHPNTIKKYLKVLQELQLISKKDQAKRITYHSILH